jgi:Phospholipid methyltransferase
MKIFEKQIWHLLFLIILLFGLNFLVSLYPEFLKGSYLNISTKYWLYFSIIIPIIHQIYVLLCWRSELHYKCLSGSFGSKAFLYYKIGFFILFVGRLIPLIFLAISNKNTFNKGSSIKYTTIIIVSLIVGYAFYSVKKYFGFDRAAGIDHFDKSIANLPFVKGGIFQYTNNGMYLYAFLVFYLPGIISQSSSALLIAFFSHIYIWIHYYFTELPDMKFIYGKKPS